MGKVDKAAQVYSYLKQNDGLKASFEDFTLALRNDKKRFAIYNDLRGRGLYTGDYNTFEAAMLENDPQIKFQFNPLSKSGLPFEAYDSWNDPTPGLRQVFNSFMSGITNTILSAAEGIIRAPYEIGKIISGRSGMPVVGLEKDILQSLTDFGVERQKAVDSLYPTDRRYSDSFVVNQLPNMFGSATGFILATAATQGRNVASWVPGTILGAMSQAESMSLDAYENTGSLEESSKAFAPGILLGATEGIPLGKGFNKLLELAKSKSNAWQITKAMLEQGLEEGTQELGQQFGENVVAKNLYDTQRDISDGLWQGGLGGFITGVTLVGIGGGFQTLDKMGNKSEYVKKGLEENEILKKQIIVEGKKAVNQYGEFLHDIRNIGLPVTDALNKIDKSAKQSIEATEQFSSLMLDIKEKTGIEDQQELLELTHQIGAGGLLTAEQVKLIEGTELPLTGLKDRRIDKTYGDAIFKILGSKVNQPPQIKEDEYEGLKTHEKTKQEITPDEKTGKEKVTTQSTFETLDDKLDEALEKGDIHGFSVIKGNEILNEREDADEFQYTEGQKTSLSKIANMIDSDEENFFLMAGYAGTGKTTILENIANYGNKKGKEVIITAPTNKAVRVIESKIGDKVSAQTKTLHKLIYQKVEEEIPGGPLLFGSIKSYDNTVIVVDESSMISSDLLDDLTKVVGQGTKVIFVGDSFQLEPVGNDPKLFEWTQPFSSQNTKTELTEVRRQQLESPILRIATKMRTTKQAHVPKQSEEGYKLTSQMDAEGEWLTDVAQDKDVVMIVATNKTRIRLNKMARMKKYGENRTVLEPKETIISLANGDTYANSDIFVANEIKSIQGPIQLQIDPNNSISVYRGEIIDNNGESQSMLFSPDIARPSIAYSSFDYMLRENQQLQELFADHIKPDKKGRNHLGKEVVIGTYGYAMTAHKSQGSQWDKVFVNFDYKASSWNPARWMYTAITRAQNSLVVVANNNIQTEDKAQFNMSDVYNSQEIKKVPQVTSREKIEDVKKVVIKEPVETTPIETAQNESVMSDRVSLKTITQDLKKRGMIDDSISTLVDWMVEKNPELEINFIAGNRPLKAINSQSLNDNNARGAYLRYKGKGHALINKDSFQNDQRDLYNVIAEEAFHDLTVQQLKNDRVFRAEVEQFMKELKSDMEANNFTSDYMDVVFGSPEEFTARIMTNTAPDIRDYTIRQRIPGKPRYNWFQRFINILKGMINRVTGRKPETFYDALEVLLNRHISSPTMFQRIPTTEIVTQEDGYVSEKTLDADKSRIILSEDLDDIRTTMTLGQLIAERQGKNVKDYYKYLQSLSFEQIKNVLYGYPRFHMAAIEAWKSKFNKKFEYYYQYTDAILTQLNNHVNSLHNYTTVRATVKTFSEPNALPIIKIEELPTIYRDKESKLKSTYKEKIQALEIAEEAGKLFGVKFEVVMIDDIHKMAYETDEQGQDILVEDKWTNIQSDLDSKETKNQFYTNLFESKGYYFLKTWSDKNTLFLIKPDRKVDKGVIDKVTQMYVEKRKDLAARLWEQTVGEEEYATDYTTFTQGLQEGEQFDVTEFLTELKVTNAERAEIRNELLRYVQGMPGNTSDLMRLVFEDIKLGGKVQGNGAIESVMYDINKASTYNGIKLFKRAWPVSPKRYFRQDEREMQKILDTLPKGHGFTIRNGKLYATVAIYNSKPKAGTTVEWNGVTYDLSQMLINKYGTERTDGHITYTLGVFDKLYRWLHGSLKDGAIKAFAINNILGNEFTDTLYFKGAWHGHAITDPLSDFIRSKNISFLVSSSVAKELGKSYPVGNIFDPNLQTFEMPMENIHRDMEKGGAKDYAKGLLQSIMANFTSSANPSFTDLGFTTAINEMVDRAYEQTKNELAVLDPTGVLQYMKDKAFTGTSEREKTIASLVLELAYTNADFNFRKINEQLLLNPENEKTLTPILQKYIEKKLRLDENRAEQIVNVFQEPYFAKMLKDYMGQIVERYTKMKIPATWLVLEADPGKMTSSRLAYVRKAAVNEYKKVKRLEYIEREGNRRDTLTSRLTELINENKALIEKGELNTEESKRAEEIKIEMDAVNDELDFFKDEGRIDLTTEHYKEFLGMHTDTAREAIDKKMNEIVDENGFLRKGYVYISQDAAEELGYKIMDKGIAMAIPMTNILSMSGVKIAAILPPHIMESGKIVMNSEDVQSIKGKDYDIDTLFFFGKSKIASASNIDALYNSINESHKKHESLMTAEYRTVLGDRIKSFADVLNNENRKEYTIAKTRGQTNVKTLYDPLVDSSELLNKFHKDIGKPVLRRKFFTMESQMDVKSEIGGIPIITNHSNAFSTYNLLSNYTEDMVDMPTNTNSFYYIYNEILNFDMDHGTHFFLTLESLDPNDIMNRDQITRLVQTVYGLKSAENYLFGYAARYTTDHNIDNRDEKREYEDDLKYILTQQKINKLLDANEKEALKANYLEYAKSKHPGRFYTNGAYKPSSKTYIEAGLTFIQNLEMKNTNSSPFMRLINKFESDRLPQFGMSLDHYLITQTDLANEILNKEQMKPIKAIFDLVMESDEVLYKDKNGMYTRRSYVNMQSEGSYQNNNKQAVQLFLMTSFNEEMHKLKAQTIALVNPIMQKTTDPKLYGKYYDAVYQYINYKVYPVLMELLIDNAKLIEFNTKNYQGIPEEVFYIDRLKDETITLKAGDKGQVVVNYKGNKLNLNWDLTELGDPQSEIAKKVKNHLITMLSDEKKANDRVAISKLLYFGGSNIPIAKRIAKAAELLNEGLPKFTKGQRVLFWTSLLGRHDSTARKYPTNLQILNPRDDGSYGNQEFLLQLISEVNDPVGKKFLSTYAQAFQNVYKGPTIKNSIDVQNILNSPDPLGDEGSEIWFSQNPKLRDAIEKEYLDENGTAMTRFKTIYEIARQVPKTIKVSDDPDKILSGQINLMRGRLFTSIRARDVIQTFKAYVTRDFNENINLPMIELTRQLMLNNTINAATGREDIRDNRIHKILSSIKQEKRRDESRTRRAIRAVKNVINGDFKNALTPFKELSLKSEITRVHDLLEQNPLNLQITRTSAGQDTGITLDDYVYHYGDNVYTSIEDLLNSAGIENMRDRLLYEASIELMKRFSVDNLEYVDKINQYLGTIIDQLGPDFIFIKELNSLHKKYLRLSAQMKGLQWHYFPRMFNKDVFRKEYKKARRKELVEEIRKIANEEIEKLETEGKADMEYASLTTEDLINDKAEKILETEIAGMSLDQFNDYIHSWQLNRKLPINMETKSYIRDNFTPERRHRRQFWQMIENDMTYTGALLFQNKAMMMGMKPNDVFEMMKWFKLISPHRMLRQELISPYKVKEGEMVQFYVQMKQFNGTYKERFVRGYVANNSDGFVKMKMDNDKLKQWAEWELKRVEKTYNSIIKNASKEPTFDQLNRIKEFNELGYLQNAKPKDSQEANKFILQGYRSFLADENNWGRFRIKDIYVKQYQGDRIASVSGMHREIEDKALDQASSFLTQLSSAVFIGGPVGAVRNYVDATWAIIRDFRPYSYYKIHGLAGAGEAEVRRVRGDLLSNITTGDYTKYLESLKDLNEKKVALARPEGKMQIAEALAAEYIVKEGLISYDQYGKDVLGEEEIELKSMSAFWHKFKEATDKSTALATQLFKKVERRVRITSAYMYAYKAIVIDNVTQPEEIRTAITKGVARTQSLYDNMYRKLNESSKFGKFLMQFTQYNHFQAETKIMELDQAKRMGNVMDQIFTTKIVDSKGQVHKQSSTVDPLIYQRWLIDWWMDGVGNGLGVLIPGFRASNPINRGTQLGLSLLAQAIITGGDIDDWDLKDFAWSILSFWAGIGISLPIQLVGSFIQSETGANIPGVTTEEKLVPVNPRTGQLVEFLVSEAPDLFSAEEIPWQTDRGMSESQYRSSKIERLLIGVNLFTPVKRRYYTDKVNEFQSRDIVGKIRYFPEKVFQEPLSEKNILIPVLNLIDF